MIRYCNMMLLLVLFAACAPIMGGNDSGPYRPVLQVQDDRETAAMYVSSELFPLRGDPNFDEDDLSKDARRWYDELWETITTSQGGDYAIAYADSDHLYNYARGLHTHIVSLLTVFRVTGDLRLLDEVDRIAQMMRDELDDVWRGTRDGTDGTRDGYLNWVYRGDSDSLRGKDLHEVNEMRAHALVAHFAWAFHNNRDLESPAGVDYGERADFWLDYLQEHFEAKWRERNGVRWPEFPFISRNQVHANVAFIKYHHYMHQLTGRDEYRREGERLSDIVFKEFREVETEDGPAFVWRRTIEELGGDSLYLMPTTYVRYVASDAVDLHLEGFYRWGDPYVPRALANTYTHFIIDNGAEDFARDVGGGEDVGGLRASPSREWDRVQAHEYAYSPHVLIAPWDPSGKIADVSVEVYENVKDSDRRAYIPAGMVFLEMLEQLGGVDRALASREQ